MTFVTWHTTHDRGKTDLPEPYWAGNGMSDAEADAQIREFNAERNAEIRAIGLRNALVGGALLVVAGGISIWLWLVLKHPPQGKIGGLAVRVLSLVLLGGLYGVWKLVNGIYYLVRPQSEDKSIPDIS